MDIDVDCGPSYWILLLLGPHSIVDPIPFSELETAALRNAGLPPRFFIGPVGCCTSRVYILPLAAESVARHSFGGLAPSCSSSSPTPHKAWLTCWVGIGARRWPQNRCYILSEKNELTAFQAQSDLVPQ